MVVEDGGRNLVGQDQERVVLIFVGKVGLLSHGLLEVVPHRGLELPRIYSYEVHFEF